MSTPKVRRTLTLDPELIDALGTDDTALSSTVNAILRREVARRERLNALSALLDRLELERGPVDQEQVAAYRHLLR